MAPTWPNSATSLGQDEQVRLIVRRVKPSPGSQLALFATYEYHPFITDREGPMLELEADHRRHAEIELVIRDLKGGPWAHMPSGRFGANAAWLALGAIAHNLARWSAKLGKITEGTGFIALATCAGATSPCPATSPVQVGAPHCTWRKTGPGPNLSCGAGAPERLVVPQLT